MKPFYLLRNQNILLIFVFSLLFSVPVHAQQTLTHIDGWNAYVHLPDDYNDGTMRKYPLICFVPGAGEVGTDASKLLVYGPSKFVASGHNMQFNINGVTVKPIVISIQPASGWPSPAALNAKLDSIMVRWRCDPARINVTGLSMGGWSWDNFVDGYNASYSAKIASIVAMSAPPPDNTIPNMRDFAIGGGRWWGFEGTQDYRLMDIIRDTLNSASPGSARYTKYIGGHCCWNTWYDPNWTENGESIYTWMLKQYRPEISGTVNPIANAGRDTAFATSITAFDLLGSGFDPNGLNLEYNWRKIQGPAAGFSSTSDPQVSLYNLEFGYYAFELKVTNTLGGVGLDTVYVLNGKNALPVSLTQFTAKRQGKSILLNWQTDNEINFDHYEIERSADGIHFSQKGIQLPNGNGTGIARYQAVDQTPLAGRNYYRLKIVDRDASFAYSKIVFIDTKSDATIDIKAYTGQKGILKLFINAQSSIEGTLVFTNTIGATLYDAPLTISAGENTLNIPFNYQKGTYYISFITPGSKNTIGIIQ